METKKSNQASLEKKRNSFLIMGVVTALSFTLMAFEYSWDTISTPKSEPGIFINLLETEIAPISIPKVEKPSMSVNQSLSNVFKIVKELAPNEPTDKVKEPDFTSVLPDFGDVFIPDENIVEQREFTIVEEMPTFPGGDDALFDFLSKNTLFPQMAVDAGISGVVYISFVVNKKGEIEKLKLLKGIGGGCDEEAMRVIQSMPIWSPGKQRGKAVKVRYNMPIRFTLK